MADIAGPGGRRDERVLADGGDIAAPGGRRDERVLADSGDIAVPGNQTRPRPGPGGRR